MYVLSILKLDLPYEYIFSSEAPYREVYTLQGNFLVSV